jgi:dihydroorotase
MLLKNAKWLGQDGMWHKGSICIEQGRIAALLSESEAAVSRESLDCSGLWIVPGAIDAHVHFREPGQVAKEGLANGALAAMTGGVTTILDMPNTVPPCSSRHEFDAKRHLFSEKAPVNWGLFLDVSVLNNAAAWSREQRPFGKLYMAKSSPARPVNDVPSVARIFSDYPLVAIHAEDERRFIAGERVHHVARPRESIRTALETIEKAWELAAPKPRLVLCHVGTADELLWARAMRAKGADLFVESCPHYLLLTQEDYLAQGAIYKVNPPLRTERDRQALLEGLRDGTIDFLSTDHAPHLPSEKGSDNPPSGIAGVEWYYPLAFHIAKVGDVSLRRLHELVCGGAARCFNIKGRDGIAVGNYADLAILDPKAPPLDRVVTRAATRPFAAVPLELSVRHLIVNGNCVLSDGSPVAGHGAMEISNVF